MVEINTSFLASPQDAPVLAIALLTLHLNTDNNKDNYLGL